MRLPKTGFIDPRQGVGRHNATFYHTMTLPGGEIVDGEWDFRGCMDEYLGHTDFSGKRVLEIGPASGLFTFEMERRGAEVTCVELGEEYTGDIVPHNTIDPHAANSERAALLNSVFNSFWYCHEAFHSRAAVYHGDARRLPSFPHSFQIGLIGAVLLHASDALGILMNCAKNVTDRMIVIDLWSPWMADLDRPMARFVPDAENRIAHIWWELSPTLIEKVLGVQGFRTTSVQQFQGLHLNQKYYTFYALVAER